VSYTCCGFRLGVKSKNTTDIRKVSLNLSNAAKAPRLYFIVSLSQAIVETTHLQKPDNQYVELF
jgi:hypothetical protein